MAYHLNDPYITMQDWLDSLPKGIENTDAANFTEYCNDNTPYTIKCECGVSSLGDGSGGKHSDWCPLYVKGE